MSNPEGKTNWKKVYFLVIAFFAVFCLFMFLFTRFTS